MIILLILWAVAGLSFGLKWYQVAGDDRAVILGKEVNVMAGPDSGDTILFRLHEGAVIVHEREEDDWTLIRLSDNKRGWIKKDAVEKITR
jgi:SH3-like domain-containing protein